MSLSDVTTKWVYAFGGGSAEGDASMRNLLGGKGANLAEMSALGLPVPPGFTITTEVCTAFYERDQAFPEDLDQQVRAALGAVEAQTGKLFGDAHNPLLVSVRSGARVSMPGMMDTVLNLGLNDVAAAGLAKRSGDARFAYDSYRRFIQMYADVVLGVGHDVFEGLLEAYKDNHDYTQDTDLSADDWKALIVEYKQAVVDELGVPFPEDPYAQLWGAIGAVFQSWMNPRAKKFREISGFSASWGTAVTVQSMVFGNMGETSATGVAFTRNPSDGANAYYGEYLINAQGEDVVAGIRNPHALTEASRIHRGETRPSMEAAMPEVYAELTRVFDALERHYRDMQDIEFTVEEGRLWMLQTRSGKRTANAALKIAVDMTREGVITEEEAVLRVDPAQLDKLLHPTIDPNAPADVFVTGLPASPGAAVGIVCFTADEAESLSREGHKTILVRTETSPEDVHGMHAAEAVVTVRGGMTSHAAVVARGMGTPCVCGASGLNLDERAGVMMANGREIKRGDIVTVDGSEDDTGRGRVYVGEVAMNPPGLTGDFSTLMGWADKVRRLKVRTNAETPSDVKTALEFGAEGIGLCRTEHMFFDAQRIAAVRQMILADDLAGREAALERIAPFQQSDFEAIFALMGERPCTIRLLDPPLHEFLPHSEDDLADVAEAAGVPVAKLAKRAKDLVEVNPMLGHRGCRLGVTFPEIYRMQARAIFKAQAVVKQRTGVWPVVEIMVPLVAFADELRLLRAEIDSVAGTIAQEYGERPPYLVGTMIELPRAALRADEIAEHADFFSFGTNDLTQTTLGLSRDDAGRFLGKYIDLGVTERDPFVTLDQSGVGDLLRIAAARGRGEKPGIKLGVCGEHGGDPASIDFCEDVTLDYVSCSPYRVPIARLAAAQSLLKQRRS